MKIKKNDELNEKEIKDFEDACIKEIYDTIFNNFLLALCKIKKIKLNVKESKSFRKYLEKKGLIIYDRESIDLGYKLYDMWRKEMKK